MSSNSNDVNPTVYGSSEEMGREGGYVDYQEEITLDTMRRVLYSHIHGFTQLTDLPSETEDSLQALLYQATDRYKELERVRSTANSQDAQSRTEAQEQYIHTLMELRESISGLKEKKMITDSKCFTYDQLILDIIKKTEDDSFKW